MQAGHGFLDMNQPFRENICSTRLFSMSEQFYGLNQMSFSLLKMMLELVIWRFRRDFLGRSWQIDLIFPLFADNSAKNFRVKKFLGMSYQYLLAIYFRVPA